MTHVRQRSPNGIESGASIPATVPRGPFCHFPRRDNADVVFDFSVSDNLDIYGLSWVLTARQVAHQDDREVWLTGIPEDTARLFTALGISSYFRFLPAISGERH